MRKKSKMSKFLIGVVCGYLIYKLPDILNLFKRRESKIKFKIPTGKEKFIENPDIVYLDISNKNLSEELISSQNFRSFAICLLEWYCDKSEDHYNLWFKHIDLDTYLKSSDSKLDQHGMSFFTPETNPENEYRLRLIKLTKDKYSPHYYALGHACHSVVYLEFLMAKELYPDQTWFAIISPYHSFVCNVNHHDFTSYIKSGIKPRKQIMIFDLLICNFDARLMEEINKSFSLTCEDEIKTYALNSSLREKRMKC